MKSSALIQDLLAFLDTSPTSWHATENIAKKLLEHSFIELNEKDEWNIQPGSSYFIRRQGSISAFITPKSVIKSATIVASHTDSPGFKLKPLPEMRRFGSILLGIEVYGAPLITSWLNRDLGLAGTVSYLDKHGHLKNSLVQLNNYPLVIPQLAIHLDREVNEKGLLLNKQEHLHVLAGLEKDLPSNESYLDIVLKEVIDFKKILNFDLFLYPLSQAGLIGYQHKLISSYRIDSLASVHAALNALLHHPKPSQETIKMIVFWDHEEIGSQSERGAGSPFFSQLLERITLALNIPRADYLRLITQSNCLSVDLAHALHPNFAEKHDAAHQPFLGEGVVLKNNAQMRYATDSQSAAALCATAEKHHLPLQKFVSRNDIPCGSTIGPIHASNTGIPTVDIGCGQLSMHSARELMSCDDQLSMYKLLSDHLHG
jgi:aspartyl aminopeptidase